jgi:ABC-type uncharacterized transport system substrate-binding protein
LVALRLQTKFEPEYVAHKLNGEKDKFIAVKEAKRFRFVINHKTAKQIGVTIPSNVLARADKVIK